VALIDAPVLREMDNLDNRLTSTIHNTVRRLIHIDDPEMGQTADVLYDILESITRECEEAKENLRRQKMLI
jgi:hypothetical protein